jgi:hypothetical protein
MTRIVFAVLFLMVGVAADSSAADGDWVQLFNGKDFTGWKMYTPKADDKDWEWIKPQMNAEQKVIAFVGKTKARKDKAGKETPSQEVTLWQIKDGCIVGGGPASHLFSERGDYADFQYRVEAKINDKGNSGQYFRTEFGGGFPRGYEAQINATHGDKVKSGSLYPNAGFGLNKEPAKHTVMNTAPHKADEFFTQEVIAVGPKITILVNGKQTVDYTDPANTFTKGHFALQGHDPGSIMTFKKVEVKELKK